MISRNITARVELLSDVHIGTGAELMRDADWIAPGDGYVYFADSDRLLEEVFGRAEADGKPMAEVARLLAGSTLSGLYRDLHWLTAADFGEAHPLFRYRLRGSPATVAIREQIKDVYGQPYLPGSSLKGALRTVLMIHGAANMRLNAVGTVVDELDELKRRQDLGDRRAWPNPKKADDRLDVAVCGTDPNHDLLRALQVGDSQPVPATQLRLRRANIYPTARDSYQGHSKGLDVDVETLARGTVFELPIHVPTELLVDRDTAFDVRRRQELQAWEQRAPWIENLSKAGKENAKILLQDEANYFSQGRDVPRDVIKFYVDLMNLYKRLAANEFLLVLGWGGGWHTKTINRALKQPPATFERIVTDYKLNPKGKRKPGDSFPKSRHLLRLLDQPGPPLGWVRVTLT